MQQDKLDWTSFLAMQENHLTCEGIYITGDAFNWLGIYHYDDYLIVGGSDQFVEDLCLLIYKDLDWKKAFVKAFDEGNISMYESDFDALVAELF